MLLPKSIDRGHGLWVVATFLTVTLTLPSHAFALRTENSQSDKVKTGLEEALHSIPRPAVNAQKLSPAAGLEESSNQSVENRSNQFPFGASNGAALPQKLLRLRTSLGLTRQEVAHEVGVTKGTYGNWETGIWPPHPSRLRKLADFYAAVYRFDPQEIKRFLGMKEPVVVLAELRGQPLSEILRSLRESQWFRQKELASAVGVHKKRYGYWEEGQYSPRFSSLQRLADYYVDTQGFPREETNRLFGIPTPEEILGPLAANRRPLSDTLKILRSAYHIPQTEIFASRPG